MTTTKTCLMLPLRVATGVGVLVLAGVGVAVLAWVGVAVLTGVEVGVATEVDELVVVMINWGEFAPDSREAREIAVLPGVMTPKLNVPSPVT